MVKEFDIRKIDEVMQIWIDTNIVTHDFIPKRYWTDNYEIVKTMLPNSEILIYEEDVIKGFVGIVDKTYIAGLFITKQFQGCGIGAELIEACKNRYPILRLDVYVKNDKAVKFYINHGFKIIDEKENSDTKEAEYTMQWTKRSSMATT